MFKFDYKGAKKEVVFLIKSKYFYIGLLVLLIGFGFNFLSQIYLHNLLTNGKTLSSLSDIILDNIPYVNLSWGYDYFPFIASIVFFIFIILRKEYKSVPYFFIILGLFYILRDLFVVLTPLGNPPNFVDSQTLFQGFSKYQLGCYPSGHTGTVFFYVLFSKGIFKWMFGFLLLVVIISLFLSRGHYSIDILSAIIFSYALCSFGEKYFKKFKLH